MKVDSLSTERTRTGREFQVDGSETAKAREEKLPVILDGQSRRFRQCDEYTL